MAPRLLHAALGFLLAASCLSKNPPVPARYFQPLGPALELAPSESFQLRVATTTQAPHLGETMTWRLSDVELAFDEQNRWAAPPRSFVEHELNRALFEESSLTPGTHRRLPGLSVHVEAFEGVRGEHLAARVVLRATLEPSEAQPSEVRRFEHVTVLEEATAPALARGCGEALGVCVSELQAWLAH